MKRKDVKLTARRIDNHKAAFDGINWDFENAELRFCGLGDTPQFKIFGTIKRTKAQVSYLQTRPGGGQATLALYTDKTRKEVAFKVKAPLKEAKIAQEAVGEYYKFEMRGGR